MKIDYDDREHRMKADPNTFFITDRIRNYPMMIARPAAIETEVLRELLDAARQHAGGQQLQRQQTTQISDRM